MIDFIDIENTAPYEKLLNYYKDAFLKKQKNIEAICVSSYNPIINEVNSRYVNLKYIKKNRFFFYSNYDSPKASEFNDHNQISVSFFWNSINVQIRMKGEIEKSSNIESDNYFMKRDVKKNALAISSRQSRIIESYDQVESNYKSVLENINIDKSKRPSYWGGFYFKPSYMEFWEGNKNRLNKRELYILKKLKWKKSYLQP